MSFTLESKNFSSTLKKKDSLHCHFIIALDMWPGIDWGFVSAAVVHKAGP